MKTSIELKNMRFFAHHGVMEQETIVGNDFAVSVAFVADLSVACKTDYVDDTISYADIYELVKAEMAIPSKLIENVAYRILKKLKETFPKIEQIEVRVAKINPPVGGQMDYAEVVVSE